MERGLDVRQARRIVQGRNKGHSPGDKPLILMRCHSCGLPQLYEALEGWKTVCGRAYNSTGINMFLFYCSSFLGMMHANPVVVGRGDA